MHPNTSVVSCIVLGSLMSLFFRYSASYSLTSIIIDGKICYIPLNGIILLYNSEIAIYIHNKEQTIVKLKDISLHALKRLLISQGYISIDYIPSDRENTRYRVEEKLYIHNIVRNNLSSYLSILPDDIIDNFLSRYMNLYMLYESNLEKTTSDVPGSRYQYVIRRYDISTMRYIVVHRDRTYPIHLAVKGRNILYVFNISEEYQDGFVIKEYNPVTNFVFTYNSKVPHYNKLIGNYELDYDIYKATYCPTENLFYFYQAGYASNPMFIFDPSKRTWKYVPYYKKYRHLTKFCCFQFKNRTTVLTSDYNFYQIYNSRAIPLDIQYPPIIDNFTMTDTWLKEIIGNDRYIIARNTEDIIVFDSIDMKWKGIHTKLDIHYIKYDDIGFYHPDRLPTFYAVISEPHPIDPHPDNVVYLFDPVLMEFIKTSYTGFIPHSSTYIMRTTH